MKPAKIQIVDINTIKPNPKNPRKITPQKMALLVESVKNFPEMLNLRPLIIDKHNVIIGGNMRYQAAISAGIKKIPIIRAESLTSSQVKEFIVKDNAAYGEWEWELLLEQYTNDELGNWSIDVPDEWSSDLHEASDDGYEEPETLTNEIKRGDLIEIGNHRLLCGDSANTDDVNKLMAGAKADMVFTDPPYGVSIGSKNRQLNLLGSPVRNTRGIKDDSLKPEQLKERLLPAFTNLRSVMSDDCTVFVTAPQGGDLGMMMMMMAEAGLAVRHVLIWKKDAPTFSIGRLDYDYQHEPIFLTWVKKHKYYGNGQHKTSVWEIPKPRRSKEHPTMKPVELVANALLNHSKAGDIVCDLYMGSGTTMVAAEQLNRKSYGMEIDPHYCAVIIDRMQKLNNGINVVKNGKPYKQRISRR